MTSWIMGTVVGCLASVSTIYGKKDSSEEATSGIDSDSHVKFAESSHELHASGKKDQSNEPEVFYELNKETVYNYKFIASISISIHFFIALWPVLNQDSFSLLEPEAGIFLILNIMPSLVQVVSICAMSSLNKPLPDGTRLNPKDAKVALGKTEFFNSLKTIVCLMAICQISSIYSSNILWLAVLILPFWCYKLTLILTESLTNIEQAYSLLNKLTTDVERMRSRYGGSPRKSWIKFNVPKSPKLATRSKSAQNLEQGSDIDNNNRATPRTRTKKAVKNFFNNVSDKYHTFEQNVAQTVSQRLNSPRKPSSKAISYDKGSSETSHLPGAGLFGYGGGGSSDDGACGSDSGGGGAGDGQKS